MHEGRGEQPPRGKASASTPLGALQCSQSGASLARNLVTGVRLEFDFTPISHQFQGECRLKASHSDPSVYNRLPATGLNRGRSARKSDDHGVGKIAVLPLSVFGVD